MYPFSVKHRSHRVSIRLLSRVKPHTTVANVRRFTNEKYPSNGQRSKCRGGIAALTAAVSEFFRAASDLYNIKVRVISDFLFVRGADLFSEFIQGGILDDGNRAAAEAASGHT